MTRKALYMIIIFILTICMVGCSVGSIKTTIDEITTGQFTEINGTSKEGSYSVVSVVFVNDTSSDKEFDTNKISISFENNTYKSIGLYNKIEIKYNNVNGEEVKVVKLTTTNDPVIVKAGDILSVKYTFECEVIKNKKVELYYNGKLLNWAML